MDFSLKCPFHVFVFGALGIQAHFKSYMSLFYYINYHKLVILIIINSTKASLGLYQAGRVICKHLHKKIEIERFDVDKRFTNAIRYGDLVFICGQVGEGSTIKEQSEVALKEVDNALKLAGTDKEHILECTVWLANMKEDYNAFNEGTNDNTNMKN